MGLCTLGLFGRHCDIAHTLAVGAVVVGGAALLIGTAGVAAPLVGFTAELGFTAETALAFADASTTLGYVSTVLSGGQASITCAKEGGSRNCWADAAETVGGAIAAGVSSAARFASSALVQNLVAIGGNVAGFVFDLLGLQNFNGRDAAYISHGRGAACQ